MVPKVVLTIIFVTQTLAYPTTTGIQGSQHTGDGFTTVQGEKTGLTQTYTQVGESVVGGQVTGEKTGVYTQTGEHGVVGGSTATGTQGVPYTPVGEQGVTGEKTGITQTYTQVGGQTVTPTGEKTGTPGFTHTQTGIEGRLTTTGVEGVPQTYTQVGEQTGEKTGTYSGVQQTVQTGTVEQGVVSTVEKTGAQVPETSHYGSTYPQNVPVPEVQSVPVGVKQAQTPQSEGQHFLPIQPLTVVPVSQNGQPLQAVVVPAEALTPGKVVILTVSNTEQTQQRSFQDVVPEQVSQPATYTPVQAQEFQQGQQQQYVQPNENQGYVPVQVREQVQNVVPQVVEPYVPSQSAEHSQQVYSVPQVVAENVEKQGYQQNQYQSQVPQVTEYQGVGTEYSQQVYQTVPAQGLYQQVASTQQQQTAEYQIPYQKSEGVTPVQNQPVVQQVYNVQHENTVPYQQHPVQQVQQSTEQQIRHQQSVQSTEYVPEPIQEVVQTYIVDQVQPQQEVGYVPEGPQRTTVQEQQVVEVQPQQVAVEHVYNFGDKVPQNPSSVHTLSSVPYNEQQSVNPSVVSSQ